MTDRKAKSSKPKEQKTKDEEPRTKEDSALGTRHSALVIVGFMGSGKTTVAKVLAEKLGCDFVDLDSFIELREGRSVASIIDAEGEASFRAVESKALRDVFEDKRARIIAPGGGAWTIEENRKLIFEKSGLTIWLDVPFEVCWERIKTENDVRPFARDEEKAKNLYDSRKAIYSLAEFHINVSAETSAEAVADEIANAATNCGKNKKQSFRLK